MGHIVGKEIYQQLGDKLDTLPFSCSCDTSIGLWLIEQESLLRNLFPD